MDVQWVQVIFGSGLAFITALIMLQLKSIRTSSDRLEATVSKRLDKQDSAIEKIKDALAELKDNIRNRQEGDRGTLIAQIEVAETELHRFQTQVLTANVTKDECKASIFDLKQRILALEKSVKDVDSVSREQSLILARIDQAIRSL